MFDKFFEEKKKLLEFFEVEEIYHNLPIEDYRNYFWKIKNDFLVCKEGADYYENDIVEFCKTKGDYTLLIIEVYDPSCMYNLVVLDNNNNRNI